MSAEHYEYRVVCEHGEFTYESSADQIEAAMQIREFCPTARAERRLVVPWESVTLPVPVPLPVPTEEGADEQ